MIRRSVRAAPLLGRVPTSPRFRPGCRHATLEAGENKSGHINAGPNEGILFFDNLFPISLFRLQFLVRTPWNPEKTLSSVLTSTDESTVTSRSIANPAKLLKRSRSGATEDLVDVVEILPRLKEGGAFVKFSHDSSTSPSAVQAALTSYLKEHKIRPWWNPFQRVRASLVLGRPWVEDLYRLPSTRLRVEFLPTNPGAEVAELSQEQLYSFFRPYGKLADIITQLSDSKILPKYAYLDFSRMRRAIMAKNCMHGFTVSEAQGGGKMGTVLRLNYEKKIRGSWLKDWLMNHPRIVIPALAALVAGITVAVFDPLRTFFIKAHITKAFHIEDNIIYKWFKTQADNVLTAFRHRSEETGMEAIWEDRRSSIEQLQTWLMETADTFIIVQGPRGSGKRELVVNEALKNQKYKLLIDCKPIQEARGDASTISAAAAEVGYRPVFSWTNSISGLIDLAAQGATGVKTGFSETLDNQLAKIWNNTATALKQIALEDRKKDDKDANLSDDEYLEAHPERRPVVVIDNFLHKSQEGAMIYDKLAEWAARLTTTNIAHVIFLTNDVSFSKSLSRALPDRVFRQISLSDCPPDVAKRFVINHLDLDREDADSGLKQLSPSQRRKDLDELDQVVSILGGRLTDLEFLTRRIQAGETPGRAVKEIVEQSASEILKMFLFGVMDEGAQRQWSPQQAWLLIKELAKHDTLRYNEVLLSDAYKSASGEKALQALEQAELISILSSNGRPQAIRPGKPVYQPAFRRLTEDRVLQARFDLALLNQSIAVESASIDKYEAELHLLGELPKQPVEVGARVNWLLAKLSASQAKIEAYEKETGALKKVLSSEY
ncbi:mitochondrial escape protein 2 [Elasticomyces elasticus]|nr:mitochondrial escape protein 2 [Elasticomyces elasticus]